MCLNYVLLFLLLVSVVVGQLVELPAVVRLDLRLPPEDVGELVDDGLLRLQPTVQAFQLLVQLNTDI